jgi:hypothetical protein
MRLIRFVVLIALFGGAAWLVARSVSVESTPERVQVTIDRQQLREAGHEVQDLGRKAADKTGQFLKQAGDSLEKSSERR